MDEPKKKKKGLLRLVLSKRKRRRIRHAPATAVHTTVITNSGSVKPGTRVFCNQSKDAADVGGRSANATRRAVTALNKVCSCGCRYHKVFGQIKAG